MATQTENYNFTKPDYDDPVDVGVLNQNFDQIDAELGAHAQRSDNPHGVTKAQVGLGSVPNVSTNDQTPTYTEASALAELSSGEKLSTVFGKLKKAVKDLIAHINARNNPHAVTYDQTGAAAASHVHSAADVTSGTLPVARGGTGVTALSTAPTSGSAAPITSGAVFTALAGKSDSGHTHSAATQSAAGLMSAADKKKLDGLADGANKTVVDASLSSSSTNPVQNKAVYTALSGKAASSHTHDDRYYTESEVDTKLAGKAAASHTHDDRYYTESEVDTKLAAKAASSHSHSAATASAAGFMSKADKSKLDGTVDYVIETGSSNGLTYAKWLSGKSECWGYLELTKDITTQVNVNLYRSGKQEQALPDGVFLYGAPSITLTPQIESSGCGCYASIYNQSSRIFRYYIYAAVSLSAIPVKVNVQAVGRWK